jgi:superfamily II DNA or RNA helicase
MSNFKSLISKVNTWSDFKNGLKPLSKLEKGNAFEELTKYYLLSNPVYKDKLKNVWLQKEIPPSVTQKINLPTNDQGIDLIAENNDGTFWAIQCKYLQDEEQRLSHRAISTFTSLSKLTAKNISYCLVATTADDYAKLYKGNNDIGFINADEWNKLNKEFFTNVRTALAGKDIKYKPYKPKPHQQKALQEASEHFLKQKNNRGKLVFPCGAGKSLTGYWIKQALNSQSTIVAVPSLSLVKQTLEVYLRESVANKQKIEWLCVCSDEGIGKNDDVVVHTNEIGVPCITDKDFIANWIKENKKKKTVIFTTYQSGKTIAEAAKIAKAKFDLGIMDEAHKTVGNQDKLFSYLLFDKNIKIDKRIFMTATERRYAGSSENILSMDDVEVYGETFTQMPFKDAINQDILSDYKIITLFISDKEVKEIIEKNAFVKPQGKEWDKETEARTLASMVALRKAMVQFPIHHAVTFHSSIKKAEAFEQSQVVLSKAFPEFQNIDSFHVSGAMPTSQRSKIVNEFASSNKAIITNAKCLTEGVDVPNIDCVLFADPRKSTVDIVQAVGRALRKKEGKQFGYVILPVFTKSKTKEEIIESAEFKEILSTLRALASNDERIIEYFRDITKNGKANLSSSIVQFDIDENVIEGINEKDLIGLLQLNTWDKLAKLSWMPFVEARRLIHTYTLKNYSDWRKFIKSKECPNDIPKSPNVVYKDTGWVDWGDWFNTGFVSTQKRSYLTFEDAKKILFALQLNSNKEYFALLKSQNPDYIYLPKKPERVYLQEGWSGWRDFLGKPEINYLSYDQTRKIVQELNIPSQTEWFKYCKEGKVPKNVPSHPSTFYKNKGWVSWSKWLKDENAIEYLPFYKARSIIQEFKFKNVSDFRNYAKSESKPKDIPTAPNTVYKNSGWISWGDWLGNHRAATKHSINNSYGVAREIVLKLGIKTIMEYTDYVKKNKQLNLPSHPEFTYKNKGWIDWSSFLGKNIIANRNKDFLSYEEAKIKIHEYKFSTISDWKKFSRSVDRPQNIPSTPNKAYQKKGWVSWQDWLGNHSLKTQNIRYIKYQEAEKYARKLNLESRKNWVEFHKVNQIPIKIPKSPDQHYKNNGWISWPIFLGTFNKKKPRRNFVDFENCKKWFRAKNITSVLNWVSYTKKNKRPDNIPRNPQQIYKNEGWKGWHEFLGTRRKGKSVKNFVSYDECKNWFIQNNIISKTKWEQYCKSNKRPTNIPRAPDRVYKEKGWRGWADFCGKEDI